MPDALEAFKGAILTALGNAPEVVEPGRWHRFSTNGKRSDTAGWAYLFLDGRGGAFGCHRQQIRENWSAIDRAPTTRVQRAELAWKFMAAAAERKAQQRQKWGENAQRIAQTWAECVPLVPDDPVTLYLKRRGFGDVASLPEVLRLHPALSYWNGADKLGTFPAMVAPIVAPDGRTVALHQTYLTPDGRKADVPIVKKLTGAAGSLAGASIALHEPVCGCIGIAEGIETALAAWCAWAVPTMASYCASNLAAWRWPAGVQRLVIFADADKAGREAAETLRARALAARLHCELLTPAEDGKDWCDVWAERGAVMIEAEGAA